MIKFYVLCIILGIFLSWSLSVHMDEWSYEAKMQESARKSLKLQENHGIMKFNNE